MNKTEYVVEYYNKNTNEYGIIFSETPFYNREAALNFGQDSAKAVFKQYGYEIYYRVLAKEPKNKKFIENCNFYYNHILDGLEKNFKDVEDRYHFSENDDDHECTYYLQYRLPFSNKVNTYHITIPCDIELDDSGDVDVARALCRILNGACLTFDECDEIINKYVEEHQE